MIKIYIRKEYENSFNLIKKTITTVFKSIGFEVSFTLTEEDADIAYGNENNDFLEAVSPEVWINCRYSTPSKFQEILIPEEALLRNRISADLIYSSYFLLSGRVEKNKLMIEDHETGVPGVSISEWGLDRMPTVDLIANKIGHKLKKLNFKPREIWPDQKKWVMLVTHDCDRLLKYRPISYIKDSYLHLKAGNPLQAVYSLLKSSWSLPNKIKEDPYTRSWKEWINFGKEIGSKNTFFIGVSSRYDSYSSIKDLHYDSKDRCSEELVNHLKENEGFELAIHTSINSWKSKKILELEKEFFEEDYGTIPKGFRAHHWSLDPENPEATLELMHSIGYEYSSSLGMNEIHGFRRGTAKPYIPISALGLSVSTLEISPTFMDESLRRFKTLDRLKILKNHIETVKSIGGVVTFDWHSDLCTPDYLDGATELLKGEIKDHLADSECWITTPSELTDWINR